MGQRLVFRCVKGGKKFATLYYHWSGYTQSIYWEAAELIRWLEEHGYSGNESIEDIQRMLLDYLEKRGGGASRCKDDNGTMYEIEKWRKRGVEPLSDGVNRTNGLIDITSRGMRESESWAEALETIDFDERTFTNNVFFNEDPSVFDWIEQPEAIPKWEPNDSFIGTIKWEDAESALRWFNELPEYEGVLGVSSDGCYIIALA